MRFASCALSGQTLVQIGAQAAPGLHIKAPVDGLVAHLHQLVTGIVLGQHLRDEFGDSIRRPSIHRYGRTAGGR